MRAPSFRAHFSRLITLRSTIYPLLFSIWAKTYCDLLKELATKPIWPANALGAKNKYLLTEFLTPKV
jgi:hypothetical protein